MKQNKQSKVVAILALCVSVLGLSLGFAAFSNTLTISSSATVSPDSGDFDINVYGYSGGFGDLPANLELYTSNVVGKPVPYGNDEKATDAKISDNGKSITISDLSAQFKEPYDGVYYYFLIKNEGAYDAYLDMTKLQDLFDVAGNLGVNHTCTASSGTTVELVNAACDDVNMMGDFFDENYDYIDYDSNSYKLSKGSYMYLTIFLDYGHVNDMDRADGEFSVDFDDVVLEFSSVPASE